VGGGHLALNGDGAQSGSNFWRICHICAEKSRSRSFCTSCGHPLCRTCTCEIPHGATEAHTAYSSAKGAHNRTPRISVDDGNRKEVQVEQSGSHQHVSLKTGGRKGARSIVKDNPFYVADRVATAKCAESKTTSPTIREDRSTECEARPEDVHGMDSHIPSDLQGNDPEGSVVHDEHHTHESKVETISHEDVQSKSVLTTTQVKIKELHQHAQDLHVHSQHIFDHLEAARRSEAVNPDHRTPDNTKNEPGSPNSSTNHETAHTPSQRLHHKYGFRNLIESADNKLGHTSRGPHKMRVSSPSSWLRHRYNTQDGPGRRLKRIDSKSTPQMLGSHHARQSPVANMDFLDRSKLKRCEPRETNHEAPAVPCHVDFVDYRSKLKHCSPSTEKPAAVKKMPSFPVVLRQTRGPGPKQSPQPALENHHGRRMESCDHCNPSHSSLQHTPSPARYGREPRPTHAHQDEAKYTPLLTRHGDEARAAYSGQGGLHTTRVHQADSPPNSQPPWEHGSSRTSSHARKSPLTAIVTRPHSTEAHQVCRSPSPATRRIPALGTSDVEVYRPTPVVPAENHHSCSWKRQYVDLAAEMRHVKAELSCRQLEVDTMAGTDDGRSTVAEAGVQAEAPTGLDDDEDTGIQGLTIVLHLKGKDDLVINTDLTHGTE
jgi:hypothetical protein